MSSTNFPHTEIDVECHLYSPNKSSRYKKNKSVIGNIQLVKLEYDTHKPHWKLLLFLYFLLLSAHIEPIKQNRTE